MMVVLKIIYSWEEQLIWVKRWTNAHFTLQSLVKGLQLILLTKRVTDTNQVDTTIETKQLGV